MISHCTVVCIAWFAVVNNWITVIYDFCVTIKLCESTWLKINLAHFVMHI